jgi:hypothetical protein
MNRNADIQVATMTTIDITSHNLLTQKQYSRNIVRDVPNTFTQKEKEQRIPRRRITHRTQSIRHHDSSLGDHHILIAIGHITPFTQFSTARMSSTNSVHQHQ